MRPSAKIPEKICEGLGGGFRKYKERESTLTELKSRKRHDGIGSGDLP